MSSDEILSLDSGTYLLGLSVRDGRKLKDSILHEALEKLGFEVQVIDGQRHRALASLKATVDIWNTDLIEWNIVHPLGFDPFSPIGGEGEMFPLKTGGNYEMRFLTRNKRSSGHAAVTEALLKMGFSDVSLFLLKGDMRLPGKPIVSMSEWIAVATWRRAWSYTTATDHDPICFEIVKPIGKEPAEPDIPTPLIVEADTELSP